MISCVNLIVQLDTSHITSQAKGHAESLDLSLVGYYQASERLDDTALAPVGEKVAQQIRSQFNDAITFVVVGH